MKEQGMRAVDVVSRALLSYSNLMKGDPAQSDPATNSTWDL